MFKGNYVKTIFFYFYIMKVTTANKTHWMGLLNFFFFYVSATWKMEPWHALEVDKSDLHIFTQCCSEATSFIHGLTENFQAVMMSHEVGQGQRNNLWKTSLQQHLLVILEQMHKNGPPCS